MVSGEDGPKGQQQLAQGIALGIMLSPMYAQQGQKHCLSSSGKRFCPSRALVTNDHSTQGVALGWLLLAFQADYFRCV